VEALYTVAVKHFGAAGHKTPKTEPAAEKWLTTVFARRDTMH
ncbi:hypothetical protein LCGC14_1568720, partial [marine sediment metagenome]